MDEWRQLWELQTKRGWKNEHIQNHMAQCDGRGYEAKVDDFVSWLQDVKQEFGYKDIVFVAGNHDVILDPKHFDRLLAACQDETDEKAEWPPKKSIDNFKTEFSNAGVNDWSEFHAKMLSKFESVPGLTYLDGTEENVSIIQGLRFYGSPWTAARGVKGDTWGTDKEKWQPTNAFERTASEREELYQRIPEDLDVLITHPPPYSTRVSYKHTNDPVLLKRLQELGEKSPRFHVFGHDHIPTKQVGCCFEYKLNPEHKLNLRMKSYNVAQQDMIQQAIGIDVEDECFNSVRNAEAKIPSQPEGALGRPLMLQVRAQ